MTVKAPLFVASYGPFMLDRHHYLLSSTRPDGMQIVADRRTSSTVLPYSQMLIPALEAWKSVNPPK